MADKEQQLQLGPVEQNPVVDSFDASLAEMDFSPEELAAPVNPTAINPMATLAAPQIDSVMPALGPQLEGTADVVNSLGVTSRYANMEDMRRAVNEDTQGGPLDEALYNLSLMEGEQRQQR